MKNKTEATAHAEQNHQKGILTYALGIFLMSVMDASAKWLTSGYAIVQLIFFESIFGILTTYLMGKNEISQSLVSPRWRLLIIRGAISIGTISFFFSALKYLPLAEVTIVFSVAPLIITAFSYFFLGESIDLKRIIAISIGFCGVLLIVNPASFSFDFALILPIGAAVCYSIALIMSKILIKTETSYVIVSYNYFVVLTVSVLILPFYWSVPALADVPIILLMGICGGLCAYFRTSACVHAPVNVLAPFEYTGMVWAILFGFLFWQELPGWAAWIGAALIAGGGIYVVSQKK